MKIAMRVASFCHYLQGPACTQYLADMGADVIKIEPLEGRIRAALVGRANPMSKASAHFSWPQTATSAVLPSI